MKKFKIFLLIFFGILIIFGIILKEPQFIFNKAIKICLSCVGIG